MMKKDGKYYFMYSCGSWGEGTYRVDYSISDSPLGPFESLGTILSSQPGVAEGPGHNGYFLLDDGEMLMVYHRRREDVKDRDARFLCIDRVEFDGDKIKPIKMT